MTKTLYLERMGCNFWDSEAAKSDIKNYRVETRFDLVKGKDDNNYFLSFSLWRNRTKARTTHKTTGRPLKYTHYDIINPQGAHIDTEFDNNEGSWRNCKLEEQLHNHNFSFNRCDILKAVNIISVDNYTSLVLLDNKTCKKTLDSINRSMLGIREKEILKNLASVEQIQKDDTYLVIKFVDVYGNYFEYEANSKRIVG